MNSCPSLCECHPACFARHAVLACGACACGIARASEVDAADTAAYDRWLHCGNNADMEYMERNRLVRLDPARLHEGTRTVIAAAFNYRPVRRSVYFADYAIGADYHYVLKQRLGEAADALCRRFGGSSRIVVDSAPMRERYWAQRAGIGFVADNGMLCVPGYGMAVVLGFILWTGEALPDTPSAGECLHCGRCRKACPGGALCPDGQLDARRCLSYLTIEHRGEFPDGMFRMPKVYGCDNCRRSCPLDCGPATDIPEFTPVAEIMDLTPEEMAELGPVRFRSIFGPTAVNRLRVQGLRRNALRFIGGLPPAE